MDHFLIDLNSEPYDEAIMHMEVGLTTFPAAIHNMGYTNEAEQTSSQIKKLRTLSNDERQAIYNMLQQESVRGRKKKGVTRLVASQFSVSIRTVQRIWKQSENGGTHANRIQINYDQIREIPLHRRTTLDSLACSLNMKKSTLFSHLKSGEIRRHFNAIKPFLTEENKRSRFQFCLSMLEGDSMPHDPIFTGKFNMTKRTENYYLLPDEEDPLCTCKSKNFIGKVMFLTVVARPRFDARGNETLSGNIGVFPLITREPAKRTSVNRAAGTLETNPMPSVNRDEKWPIEDSNYPIFIQQDNARKHIDRTDDEFRRAAAQDEFDIRLMSQPPKSPNLNVLDLGFFRVIQSLEYKEPVKTVDKLATAVKNHVKLFW
ncbi:hypothetical protein ABFS83_13G034300 [Erythranthe nasuta]